MNHKHTVKKTSEAVPDKDAGQLTPERDAIYQVSSTRSKSSRKVRYVESSAPADGECKFCLGSLADKDNNS